MHGSHHRPAGPIARFRRWRHRTSPTAVILRYHRIADLATDPFDHAVSPDRFADQMTLLRRRFAPIPLDHVAERRSPPGAVAITFDDGYRDVVDAARPILAERDMTGTVFVVAGMVDGTREFWWDTLARIFLQPGRLPEQLALPDGTGRWDLGTAARLEPSEAARFRVWSWRSPDTPTMRHRIFRVLHDRLKDRHDPERTAVIDWIRHWAGIDPAPRRDYLPLSAPDLAALVSDPSLSVGAHSMTHPNFAGLPRARRREEIAGAKSALESLTGRPVTAFAYPYGREARSRRTVEAANYRCACTTEADLVYPDTDRFRLPRIFVGNWSADALEHRLAELGLR